VVTLQGTWHVQQFGLTDLHCAAGLPARSDSRVAHSRLQKP